LWAGFILLRAVIVTLMRRISKGPLRPGWTTLLEITTTYLRDIEQVCFRLQGIDAQRLLADALVFDAPALKKVRRTSVAEGSVHGCWYDPGPRSAVVLYFLHGGGYAFASRLYENFNAVLATTTGYSLFALDYSLAPEHPYPAQVEQALTGYTWLRSTGIDPTNVVVIGDSAGGNLALALALVLRERNKPAPALVVGLSPWVDITCSGDSMVTKEGIDWVSRPMAVRWGEWYHQGAAATEPLVSPLYADLRGLPPLYVQAGTDEILIDQIRAFVASARGQGAAIDYEEWEGMTHDFQAYGDLVPQAAEALNHLKARIQTATEQPEEVQR
jgi:monoterpene epsilon-lactone hydrolase